MNINDIIDKLKQTKSILSKKNHINYEKAKSSFDKLLKSLLNANILTQKDYTQLMNKLTKKQITIKADKYKTAGMKRSVLIFLLISIIDVILIKSAAHLSEIKTVPQQPQIEQSIKPIKNNDIKQTEKTNNNNDKQVNIDEDEDEWQSRSDYFDGQGLISYNEQISEAFYLIKHFQGTLIGNVYDKNGKIIERNVHVVYDDKMPMRSPLKKWNGRPETLQRFINNCVGTPTIGYGTTFKQVINKGYITEEQAERYCRDYIKEIRYIIIDRLGGDGYWENMNLNQRIATLSYFYNCGPYVDANKQLEAIRKQKWKQAAKNMDIIKSNGKIVPALQKRRAEQQKIFLTQ